MTLNLLKSAAAVAAALILLPSCSSKSGKSDKTDTPPDSIVAIREDPSIEGRNIRMENNVRFIPWHRPVVVDFYADWCPPCKALKPVFHQVETEYAGKCDFVSINVDESPEIAKEYGVTNIPTLVFIRQGGIVVEQLTGYMDQTELTPHVESLLKVWKECDTTDSGTK